MALPTGIGGTLLFRDDPSDSRVERGGGVVVGQVSLAAGGREEATDIVTLLGEAGEAVGKDGCVGISASDAMACSSMG